MTALVADLLNSDVAAARLTAIRLLPELQGLLSEDVAHKLGVLMWDDWDPEVSRAVEEIGMKMNQTNEKVKVNGLGDRKERMLKGQNEIHCVSVMHFG